VADALAAHGCKFLGGHKATWEGVPHEIEAMVASDLAGTDE